MEHIVVVGAGQAGASLVARLRAKGFAGRLTLIGNEPELPYQRPPLSKAYLLGETDRDRLSLRAQSYYDRNEIEVLTGLDVSALDPGRKCLQAGGREIRYDRLVLTLGAQTIRLPKAAGGDLEGVFTLRSLADMDRIAPYFRENARLLVVGGGYIGLEAASVARKLGLQVTLVEMGPRILGRVAAVETSDYFRALHESQGVKILEGVGLQWLLGNGHVAQAELTSGQSLDVDFVIAGIGIRPETRLAETAGLVIDNGIATDAFGRTSDPFIWAAGDCASFPWQNGRLRLESVGNAVDQAERVADNLLGANLPYVAKPWFWSDQYDTKLQITGLNTGYDRVVTRPGAGQARSHWYYAGARLLAVDAINDGRTYMIAKKMIESGLSPEAERIADPQTDLKALLQG